MAEASGAAFAATWRDERGEIVATTHGGTMCLWPRKPWRIRISREGFEHVIRCGECPGCAEFDRRRLAERLHSKYGGGDARGATPITQTGKPSAASAVKSEHHLFVIRIWAPIELHASIAHKLHRRRGLQLEPGMWRLGASSFALIARAESPLRALLKRIGVKHRIEPLRLRRGRRAWRPLTAGLLVAREIYGEQRNRFYARGLPPADRQKWEVQKIAKYQSYDRARSPRAWKSRGVVLVPPDVWRLCRADRRSLRGLLLRQPDPEGVRKVMGMVADVIREVGNRFTVSAPPKAVLSRADVVAWYQRNAERSKARTIVTESVPDLPPLSEVGGYTSSEHSQGELLPRMVNGAPAPTPEQRRERRLKWEMYAGLERLRQKIQGGAVSDVHLSVVPKGRRGK